MSVRRGPRKSLINFPSASGPGAVTETESTGINDDESERRERRRVISVVAGQTPLCAPRPSSGKAKLAKMTIAERNDHIEKCMQLSAENKINTKNAFSLLLIDQLIEQVKRQESNFQVNFQIAGTQLDASAKIYACRVDKVHTEALRIAGGLIESDKKGSKKKPAEENEENSDDPGQSGDEMEMLAAKDKKVAKKKRSKVVILKNDMLTSNNHLKNMLKSTDGYLQEMITSAEASEPGNAHFMSNLGLSGTCELLLFPDLLSNGPRCAEDSTSTVDLRDLPVPKSLLPTTPPWSIYPLCPPLKTLLSDAAACSDVPVEPDFDDYGGAADFQAFEDGDAGLDDQDDMFCGNELDNDDADDDLGSEAPPVACRPEPSSIVDFTSSITTQLLGPLQYSWLHKKSLNLMAGPDNWKIGSFITNRPSECMKKVVTKRKSKDPITLEYLDCEESFQPLITCNKNVLASKTTTLTWKKKSNSFTPVDDIDLTPFEKVWVRPLIQVQGTQSRVQNDTRNKSNGDTVQTIENGDGDVDSGHGDDHVLFMDDDSDQIEPGFGLINSYSQDIEHGSLQTNMMANDAIPYALRAKKIDMKLLKVTVWKIIKLTDSNKENMTNGSKGGLHLSFQDLYHDLPTKLPMKMSEVLTPHLAFMALLHLANEENLSLQETADLTDVIISYG